MTDAEVFLWLRVPANLVVEVDGEARGSDAEIQHDRRRDAYMKERGWHVLRVTNEDVYKRPDMVIEGIALHLQE